MIVVGFQIDHTDDAAPDAAVEERTLHVDIGGGEGAEDPCLKIAAHAGVDGEDALVLCAAELRLWEYDVVGGGLPLCLFTDGAPVLGLRGKLITGNDSPVGQIGFSRDQQIRGLKDRHDVVSLLLACY